MQDGYCSISTRSLLSGRCLSTPSTHRWNDAAIFYGKAAELAPAFSFAACNRALALYQMGEEEPLHTTEALREMR